MSTALVAQADAAAHESRTLKPNDGTSTTTRSYLTFGDSIAAGYCGIFCRNQSFAVRHARSVAEAFDATVSYRGRAVSGDKMDAIADEAFTYRNEIASADFIALDGCGNDYLSARSSYRNQNDCSNETVIAAALDTCHTELVRALDTIAAHKKPGATVVITNLYYPGVATDKGRACGQGSHFDVFLDYLVESNWITCTEALARGFECADAFAVFNAPDFDSDNDGVIDREEIRFDPISDIDDFDAYYTRVVIENKHLIGDANQKRISPNQTVDYLLSDDTHPTNAGHTRLGEECADVSL